jgi:hypothetical protein
VSQKLLVIVFEGIVGKWAFWAKVPHFGLQKFHTSDFPFVEQLD